MGGIQVGPGIASSKLMAVPRGCPDHQELVFIGVNHTVPNLLMLDERCHLGASSTL
jgi:hypothetical protein